MTVTALGGSRQLLQVKVAQMPARRLHNAPAVRPGVVGVTLAKGETLSHLQFPLVPMFMNCARETGHVTMADTRSPSLFLSIANTHLLVYSNGEEAGVEVIAPSADQ